MKLHYACEVCGRVYRYKESAEFCEAQAVLPPPKYAVGDTVWVRARYGPPESDIIKGHTIAMKWPEDDHLDSWMTLEGNLDEFARRLGRSNLHEHVYRLAHLHQAGDDDYSSKVAEAYAFPTEEAAKAAGSR
jgi:hypothetical protein